MPTGSMQMFGGTTAPAGWLICDGSAVSRTTYADLFAVTNIAYGSGDGSTTFNLPDMRGRMPIGVNGGDLDFKGRGFTGGGKTHNHPLSDAGQAAIALASAIPSIIERRVSSAAYTTTIGSASSTAAAATYVGSTTSGAALLGTTDNAIGTTGMPPYVTVNFLIKT
jgi:microcystin-dependent protein